MPAPTDPYTFADGPGNTASGVQVNARFNALYGAMVDVYNQLASLASARSDRQEGTASLTFPGGSMFTNVLTVSHSLGVVPGKIFVSTNSQQGTGLVTVTSEGATSTTITIRGATAGYQPPGGASVPVSWMVVR